MGLDPIALRQKWDADANRHRLYAWASKHALWLERQPPRSQMGRFRRGTGVAAANWFYWWQPGAEVELSVRDGRLIVANATQDMGTGSRSVLAHTIAGAFNLSAEDVEVRIGDSALPEGPISGGSRTSATLIPAALAAAERLKVRLRRRARGARSATTRPGAKSSWPHPI